MTVGTVCEQKDIVLCTVGSDDKSLLIHFQRRILYEPVHTNKKTTTSGQTRWSDTSGNSSFCQNRSRSAGTVWILVFASCVAQRGSTHEQQRHLPPALLFPSYFHSRPLGGPDTHSKPKLSHTERGCLQGDSPAPPTPPSPCEHKTPHKFTQINISYNWDFAEVRSGFWLTSSPAPCPSCPDREF